MPTGRLNTNSDPFDTTSESFQSPSYHTDEHPPTTPMHRNPYHPPDSFHTPAPSSYTPSSMLDPKVLPFFPENNKFSPNMPPTPSSMVSRRIQRDSSASSGLRQFCWNDSTGGEALSYVESIVSHASPLGESAFARLQRGTIASTESFQGPQLQEHRRLSEIPLINLVVGQQVGTQPSHDIGTWLQESYTVPGSTLQLPHHGAPSRQRQRARTSASRPRSSAGRSYGALSDTSSFTCLSEGCGKTFNTRGKLNKHARYHMPGPLECPECGQRAHFKKDLERHMRTHTGERPFKCPVEECPFHGLGFGREDHRERHLASQHPLLVAPGTPMTGISS